MLFFKLIAATWCFLAGVYMTYLCWGSGRAHSPIMALHCGGPFMLLAGLVGFISANSGSRLNFAIIFSVLFAGVILCYGNYLLLQALYPHVRFSFPPTK